VHKVFASAHVMFDCNFEKKGHEIHRSIQCAGISIHVELTIYNVSS
jgi:hypothetical protein